MKPPSGQLARRQLLLGLALGLATDRLPAQTGSGTNGVAMAPATPWLQRLRVPDPADPWQIDAYFDNHRVHLILPQEQHKIALLPPAIQATVRRRIAFRQHNIGILRQVVKELERALHRSPPILPAQHEQTLEQLVMALPQRSGVDPATATKLHEPLLAALPDYARVDFFLPEELVSGVSRHLQSLGMAGRVRLYGEKEFELSEDQIPLRHQTTYWIRDVFMSATDRRGHTLLLRPLAFYQINDLSRPDNDYVARLVTRQRSLLRVPLFFKGGNLAVVAVGGRRILFIGQDELTLNEQFYYTAFFYFPPPDAVLELFRQIAGADAVEVLPNSKNLYHLDMVMAVLGPAKVALIDPLDDALETPDQLLIAQVRKVLTELGVRLVRIPTRASWVREFKSPVNILPFRHRDSGVASALVPEFGDQTVTVKGQPVSIHQKIRQAYADAGVNAIFAASDFYRLGGNFHCAAVPLK